ncbi:MAG: PA2779 family protein [Desulfuromonadales bacterium]
MLKKLMRPVSLILVVSFCLLNFNVPNAQAKMVGTETMIAEQQALDQQARVADFMAREDVKQIMTEHGVDPVEAQQRVDSLSDEELAKLASSIDQLPAGGDGVGVIVGAAVLIFLVLLITDVVGLTHVFPFVSHSR